MGWKVLAGWLVGGGVGFEASAASACWALGCVAAGLAGMCCGSPSSNSSAHLL